jgi:cytochrome c biogenesis protein CcmG/thiol:disulfide interchange protein DsbE
MNRLRWLLVPVVVVPVAWLLFTGLGRDPRDIPSPLVGRPLPVLAGTTLTGEQLSTVDLVGTPMLINAWASWCIPACVVEHPVLMDAARRHAGDLALVGVLYQDTVSGARAFLARYGDGGWPHLLDLDGRMAVELGITGPPETFFVDAAGIVRAKHIGPLTEADLDRLLPLIGVPR